MLQKKMTSMIEFYFTATEFGSFTANLISVDMLDKKILPASNEGF